MGKIKYFIGYVLYNGFAKHLPPSFSRVKIGQKALRGFCAKLMLSKVGKKVNIEKGAAFTRKCTIGNRSGIGLNAKIGSVNIGDNVMMGPDCVMLTRNHDFTRTDIPMIDQGFRQEKPITIGNDVWIGERVIILPGVKIGNGVIIGAGSIVTKDVKDFDIVAGNPAKPIRNRVTEK